MRLIPTSTLLTLVCISAPSLATKYLPGRGPTPNASCSLVYNRGALIERAKVVAVYWGSGATGSATKLADFYAALVQSPYFDWLREYDQSPYSIVRGSYAGAFIDTSPPSSTSVDDYNDIQGELDRLITAKSVPAPDDNTIYVLHFPPGVVITQAGQSSCNSSGGAFCAFHNSYQDSKGRSVRYAVIPDMSASGCADGCSLGASSAFIATTVSASHEILEAITDPDAGTGWYSQSCGENADICETASSAGKVGSYTVQLVWSNKQNACVDHDSAVKVADYSLALDYPTVIAAIGGTTTVTLSATPAAGSSATSLDISLAGLPSGISGALSSSTMMSNGSATLTLTVPAGTPAGSFTYTITTASHADNVIHTVAGSGTLAVLTGPPPDMAQPSTPGDNPGAPDAGSPATPGTSHGAPDGSQCTHDNQCASGSCHVMNGHGLCGEGKTTGGCSVAGVAAIPSLAPLALLVVAALSRRRR